MADIGIITCQSLELEIAYVLNNDVTVSDVFVLENEYSKDLFSEIKQRGKKRVCPLTAVTDLKKQPGSGHRVVIQVMEAGLHSKVKQLQSDVVAAATALAGYVDTILLGYGLCGNALNPDLNLFADLGVPVMLPMDGDHPVDDCVGLIIGGREEYHAQQRKCAGTMYMNAGFSRHWRDIMYPEDPKIDPSQNERILGLMMQHYKRSLLLPTNVMGEAEILANTKEFNARFNLRIESIPGTLALLEQAWEKTKAGADGTGV